MGAFPKIKFKTPILCMELIKDLNPEQQKAVTHKEGPVLIIAGAGSGKTRVLTYRIAWLMEQGIDPFNILSLTFTNKAATEMKDRVRATHGPEAKNLWMGTFHSTFARILRVHSNKTGFPKDFTIYDKDDSKNLVKTLIKENNLDDKIYKPNSIVGRISWLKNNFIYPKDYFNSEQLQAEDHQAGRLKMGELYQWYLSRCFRSGAMDFDDLLVKTYELLQNNPDILHQYQHYFKYILVDEYQDTNYVQYLILKKLAAAHENICVVGDDFQSIYAFRGADIDNILNFEKDYPDLSIYKLEQNYRSTQTIVEAADSLIKNNRHQLDKVLWTSNNVGDPIKVHKTNTDNEEGKFVAQTIFDNKVEKKRANKDYAILYRTNAQSRAFEEALRKMNIPYRIIGGISFYQRAEIKHLLAYLRIALNPSDEEALKRIINLPARGIGKTTQDKLIARAREQETSLWEVVKNSRIHGITGAAASRLEKFSAMMERFMAEAPEADAYELAMEIAKTSGLLSVLYEDKTPEGITKYENVQELLNAIKQFSERTDLEDQSLSRFMQEIALLTNADEQSDNEDVVTLMTVHGAKGLEFPVVFIGGMEENLFPSQMSLSSREDLEEERRLFYVAITRGMEEVYLTHAENRFRYGNIYPCEPSRFLEEIDPKYLNYSATEEDDFNKSLHTNPSPRVTKKQKSSKQPSSAPDPNFQGDDLGSLKTGMEVEHNKFGTGKVLQIEGEGNNRKSVIYFNDYGQKTILLKYARMKILKNT